MRILAPNEIGKGILIEYDAGVHGGPLAEDGSKNILSVNWADAISISADSE